MKKAVEKTTSRTEFKNSPQNRTEGRYGVKRTLPNGFGLISEISPFISASSIIFESSWRMYTPNSTIRKRLPKAKKLLAV